MSEPVLGTGSAFWISYFRRKRLPRLRWWHRLVGQRCGLCGLRLRLRDIPNHVMVMHPGSGRPA